MRHCCLYTGQQVPPSTIRTYNKQQSALVSMQTVTLIIPVRVQNWRFCCPGNPKIHNQYFLFAQVLRPDSANIEKFIQQFKCRLFFHAQKNYIRKIFPNHSQSNMFQSVPNKITGYHNSVFPLYLHHNATRHE